MRRKIRENLKKIQEYILGRREVNNFFLIASFFFHNTESTFRELQKQELWINVKSKGGNIPKILGFENTSERCLRLIASSPKNNI